MTVFAMHFDKTQELKARQEWMAEERKQFWTQIAINMARIFALLALLFTIRLIFKRGCSTTVAQFLTAPDSIAALMVAAGLFFGAYALGLWRAASSWQAISSVPGAFFLIIGIRRTLDLIRTRTDQKDQETE